MFRGTMTCTAPDIGIITVTGNRSDRRFACRHLIGRRFLSLRMRPFIQGNLLTRTTNTSTHILVHRSLMS